jgi:hypothetical protein
MLTQEKRSNVFAKQNKHLLFVGSKNFGLVARLGRVDGIWNREVIAEAFHVPVDPNAEPARPVRGATSSHSQTLQTIRTPWSDLEIRQAGRRRVLSARQGTFSVHDSARLITGFSWDCLSVAAGFGGTPRDVLLLGLGGGTVAGQCRRFYPRCRIDGVEWDREVIRAGRRYFHLGRMGVNVIHAEAGSFVAGASRRYDAVLDDVWPGRPGLAKPLFSRPGYARSVARLLRAGGVYAVNLWCGPGRSSELRKAARLLAPLNAYG